LQGETKLVRQKRKYFQSNLFSRAAGFLAAGRIAAQVPPAGDLSSADEHCGSDLLRGLLGHWDLGATVRAYPASPQMAGGSFIIRLHSVSVKRKGARGGPGPKGVPRRSGRRVECVPDLFCAARGVLSALQFLRCGAAKSAATGVTADTPAGCGVQMRRI